MDLKRLTLLPFLVKESLWTTPEVWMSNSDASRTKKSPFLGFSSLSSRLRAAKASPKAMVVSWAKAHAQASVMGAPNARKTWANDSVSLRESSLAALDRQLDASVVMAAATAIVDLKLIHTLHHLWLTQELRQEKHLRRSRSLRAFSEAFLLAGCHFFP